LLSLIVNPDNGDEMFPRNVKWISTAYMALYLSRQNSSTRDSTNPSHLFPTDAMRIYYFCGWWIGIWKWLRDVLNYLSECVSGKTIGNVSQDSRPGQKFGL
jgi:hypothetical protein